MHQPGQLTVAWDYQTGLRCYGARLHLRCNDEALWARAREFFPPHSREETPQGETPPSDSDAAIFSLQKHGEYFLIWEGEECVEWQANAEAAWRALESRLHFAVALQARGFVFVHAGVVGWKGRALVIPGRTMTGKTTLVAALVQAGARYYSDEYAIFGSKGRVFPYAKPLSIRQTDGKTARVFACELGGQTGKIALPLGAVIVAPFARSGAHLEQTSGADGAMALFANTIHARLQPELSLSTFSLALKTAICWNGKRGDAHEMANIILKKLRTKANSQDKLLAVI